MPLASREGGGNQALWIVEIAVVSKASPKQGDLPGAGQRFEILGNTVVTRKGNEFVEVKETHPVELPVCVVKPVLVGLGLLVSALEM